MNIESEINKIKERNCKVEKDKAWETSKTRKVLVTLTTYFVMTLVMFVLKMDNPFLGAIIPTLGFVLSTLSVDIAKGFWLQRVFPDKGSK